MSRPIAILSAARTPMGGMMGSLSSVHLPALVLLQSVLP